MSNLTRIARELHLAASQKEHIVSDKKLETILTDHTSFISKVGASKLTIADCTIDNGIDFDHVFVDEIQIILTRCFYKENGINIKNSVFQYTSEESVALQIINDCKLPQLTLINSVVDGVRIAYQQSHINIVLEGCVFRKNFFLSLAKDATCKIRLKNCTFTKGTELIVLGPDLSKEFVDISADWYSARYLENFLHQLTVQ